MKKLILALFCFSICLSFVACSGDSDTTGSKTSDKNNTTSTASDSSMTPSENSSMTPSESSTMSDTETGALKDGTYTAEADDYDKDGYMAIVKLTVKDEKIKDIDLDAVDKKGEYKKDSDNSDWIDKIVLFEQEMVAKGIEAIDIASDGTVNGIEGFDLNLGEYSPLINEAIDKAKK